MKPWMHRLTEKGKKTGFERACPKSVAFYGNSVESWERKGFADHGGKPLRRKKRKKRRFLPDLTAEAPKGMVYVE